MLEILVQTHVLTAEAIPSTTSIGPLELDAPHDIINGAQKSEWRALIHVSGPSLLQGYKYTIHISSERCARNGENNGGNLVSHVFTLRSRADLKLSRSGVTEQAMHASARMAGLRLQTVPVSIPA